MSLSFSFVIPCYKSEHTVGHVVSELKTRVKELQIKQYEIVLVNDCSPDNVWEIIQNLCKDDDHIRGISLARNFGQHAALLAGYSFAKGDIIVSLDDDGQAPVDELNLLINKMNEGYDVVYAYFDEVKQNIFRRIGSSINLKMTQWILGFPKWFKGSSFFLVKKFVVDEMIKYDNPYPYMGGLVYRTTHNIACVLTHHRERECGRSGYNFKRLFQLWLNGFTAFSVKPIRVGTFVGIFLSVCSFLASIVLVARKMFNPSITLGWTSIIITILLVGGMNLAMMGLVGEYVGRTYISVNKSPQYVVKEII